MKTIVPSCDIASYKAFRENINAVLDVYLDVYNKENLPPTIMIFTLEKDNGKFKTNAIATPIFNYENGEEPLYNDGILLKNFSCPEIKIMGSNEEENKEITN